MLIFFTFVFNNKVYTFDIRCRHIKKFIFRFIHFCLTCKNQFYAQLKYCKINIVNIFMIKHSKI